MEFKLMQVGGELYGNPSDLQSKIPDGGNSMLKR